MKDSNAVVSGRINNMQDSQIGQIRRLLLAFVAASAVVLPCNSQTNQGAERFYLIEIVDSAGEKTYQTVELDRYHQLRDEAATRNRFQPKALAKTKEEWKELYATASKAFPPKVASPESVTSLGLFTSQEAARTKMMELKARIELRRASDAEKLTSIEKQIKMLRDQIRDLNDARPYSISGRDDKLQDARNALKILERNYAELQEKKSRQEHDLQEARSMYDKNLTALVSEAAK